MELNRKHFRAFIFYNFRRGLTQQQCIDELNSIFGGKAPSRTSVYRWYDEFNRDRSSLQDEFKSVVVPETIDAVCQLILQDRQMFGCQKNLFALDPTLFVKRTKKFACRLVERNVKKIESRCFETRL